MSDNVFQHTSTSENCSVGPTVVKNKLAPTGPDLDSNLLELWVDQKEFLPAVNLTWRIEADGCYCHKKSTKNTIHTDKYFYSLQTFFCFAASVFKLRGTVINIMDEITNCSVCVRYSYNLSQTFNTKLKEKVSPLLRISLFVLMSSFEEPISMIIANQSENSKLAKLSVKMCSSNCPINQWPDLL